MKKRYLIPILLPILIVGGMLGVSCTKPDIFEKALDELTQAETRLGEMDTLGRFYTLREFGLDIARLTEPLPDYMITEENGFSELVIFYKQSEASWEEYSRLPMDMESLIACVAEELHGSENYWLAEALWDEYDKLPSTPTNARIEYRENHPEVDAMLIFWGKVSKSVFWRGSAGAEEVANLLLTWFDYYDIDKSMHPAFATWELLK